ncbi:LysR substrate-binding domain-containing protein [Pseudomonas saponiphila]|uniref:LysR substrate-binding domain-containing protein n=1 Tax=Pseudomonas sp. TMW22090 TaxID=2506434 RepID=UPI001F0E7709|nr:LysR substrate-binding domain-containing protein [Pseudomonas sp. TMW22090]
MARTGLEIIDLKLCSLQVACAPALGLSFLPRAICAFLNMHEHAQITLVVQSSREVVDAIVGERCDVGFIAQPNAYPSPSGEKIIQSSLRCALPFDHPLRDKAVIVPQELEGECFISYPHALASRQHIDSIFAAYGVERRMNLETQHSMPMCGFVEQVHELAQKGMAQESEQFLAFTLGYITHLGTDTIGHAFVNEQCGGPFRNHPQRHHLIENHIDAWNYSQTAPGGKIAQDPWGHTTDYPELSMSALWYAVQITPDDPDGKIQGAQRPTGIPEEPDARDKALDVDGNMPEWMAEAIVNALIDTFGAGPHPQIFPGSNFQSSIDSGLLTALIENVIGKGSDEPFS